MSIIAISGRRFHANCQLLGQQAKTQFAKESAYPRLPTWERLRVQLLGYAFDEHRARIQMPEGVEFRIAEAGSGTTRTTGQIPLPDLENTRAQFAHIQFSNKGVVD